MIFTATCILLHVLAAAVSYSSDIEEIILKIAEASSTHHIVLSSTSGLGGRVSMSAVRKNVFVIIIFFFFCFTLGTT